MKVRIVIILIGIILTLMGLGIVKSKNGYCSYCYPWQCVTSNICSDGCICAKQPGNLFGFCADIGELKYHE